MLKVISNKRQGKLKSWRATITSPVLQATYFYCFFHSFPALLSRLRLPLFICSCLAIGLITVKRNQRNFYSACTQAGRVESGSCAQAVATLVIESMLTCCDCDTYSGSQQASWAPQLLNQAGLLKYALTYAHGLLLYPSACAVGSNQPFLCHVWV